MEDFYINNTSQDNSYYYSNTTINKDNYDHHVNQRFILQVATYIISGIGLPLTLVAIYTLYSEVKNDHVAPIYVINLLLSDLIQFCCSTVAEALTYYYQLGLVSFIFSIMYFCSLLVSVCFMVCIALERFLVIVCPLWYRCRRSIKSSVLICVLVWVVPSVLYLLTEYLYYIAFWVISTLLLLPFPLFIFFLVGVLKALSASISVPSDEKRRIVGILVLVLLIYTLLFLPSIIGMLLETYNETLNILSLMFLRLSPLADLVLYIFMRKGIIEKILASVCCCRKDSNDISSSSV
ncbi:proteinase-activated receptor 1-like [Dicentrarchus labrax]|uniref:proteinase-activated receptor 1-like n=1 Tax=Dicentrarchus labrax TaxID=13489 RepID=UPI0021F6321A|nr:proteinase-activated receptor 1-like [Dicentrarchus labrax]